MKKVYKQKGRKEIIRGRESDGVQHMTGKWGVKGSMVCGSRGYK